VDADGSHEWRLTEDRGDPATPTGLFFQLQPAWSPDGASIAFVSRRKGHPHIYVMDADGSGTRQLTSGPDDDLRPSWSPDGGQIVFARGGALYVLAARGGPARRVARGLQGNAGSPAWSPNGKLIAFDYRRPGYTFREIWVVRPDGRGARPVTRLRHNSSLPAWSPRGDRLAFQSDARSTNEEIYSIGLAGGGVRRLTKSAVDTIDPAWSATGTLAFSRDGAIWTLDPSGRTDQLTSAGNDASPAWRPRS
jgi:TolB protein